MVEPKYKRILIKLSGEALAGEKGVGIDIQTVQKMAEEIKEVHDLGVQIALVIGGGNLWRGEPAAEAGMDRVQAEQKRAWTACRPTILVCWALS